MHLNLPFLSVIGLAVLSDTVAAADCSDKAEYVAIPIDHNDSSVGTYQNRYYVNEEHYAPGGPIFLYDGGENGIQRRVSEVLFNPDHYFNQLLEEFHGMGILWEHRYYGDSRPFPMKLDPTPEQMKYLTTKQALADIPYFAKNFSRENFSDVDLTPQGTPWIMLGESYPGMRSALSRNEYPNTIFAAYASSAIVQARVDFSSYYEQVYRGMLANGFGACVKDLQAAMRYIDDQLSRDDTAAAIKERFLGPGAERNQNDDFAKAIGYVYSEFQSDGMNGNLKDFCEHLKADADTNRTSNSDGLTLTYGSQYVTERFASWPGLAHYVNAYQHTNCKGLNKTEPLSCKLSKQNTNPDAQAWIWQYCTEWGFFESNNFGPHALLSKYLTLEYEQSFCNHNFPSALKSGALPPRPQADNFNAEFGGWTIRPSNVYWSAGQWDPWRPLTPLSTEDFAPKGINFTTEVPACGVQTGEDTLFGYIIEGAEHGFDLSPTIMNSTSIQASQNHFRRALREWLPCFKSKSSGSG